MGVKGITYFFLGVPAGPRYPLVPGRGLGPPDDPCLPGSAGCEPLTAGWLPNQELLPLPHPGAVVYPGACHSHSLVPTPGSFSSQTGKFLVFPLGVLVGLLVFILEIVLMFTCSSPSSQPLSIASFGISPLNHVPIWAHRALSNPKPTCLFPP